VKLRPYLLPKKKAFADMQNFRVIDSKFKSRLAGKADSDSRDILGYMLKEEGPNISAVEMRLNSATIIGAGQGATATWLSTCVHSLSYNRDAFRKLKEELHSAFGAEDEMTADRIAKLPYLAAVMDEALRLHCPSPTSTGRFVPEGGELIDGRWVPAGTTVGVHQHAAYHLGQNFHKCDEFHPERFLPSAREPGSPFAGDQIDVFHPFSIGPRICLGYKSVAPRRHFRSLSTGLTLFYRFTTAATRIILAKMVFHFDWQVLPESDNWRTCQKATMAWHRVPLYCRLELLR
jgi:cytochrome P450